METYELEYGIQKGDGTELPLALATMKRQNDFVSESDWERTMKILVRSKLHNVTGLNIEQQLDLPRWKLQMLLKVSEQVAKEEAPILAEMEARAKEAGALRGKNS